MILTLVNLLTGPLTSGGSWALTSGPIGAPAAPGTWNGTVNFTAAPIGDYVYTYTVSTGGCSANSTVSLSIKTAPLPFNDTCVGSIPVPYNVNNGTGDLIQLNSKGDCIDFADPTMSAVGLPASWTTLAPAPDGDLWYSIHFPATGTEYGVQIIVNSANYGVVKHEYPILALYTGTCAGLVLNTDTLGTSTQAVLNLLIPAVLLWPATVYLRVASGTNVYGLFDIIISTTI